MVNAGELLGANANRSPTAYEANPAAERARYAHDTDKLMTQLKLVDGEGRCSATTRAFLTRTMASGAPVYAVEGFICGNILRIRD